MRNLNLFLAILWAVIGAGVIYYHKVNNPDDGLANVFGSGMSIGWLAGLLVIYNLVRWWNVRSYYSDRQSAESVMEARHHRDRAESQERRHDEAPDPNFDFTDRPAGSNPRSEDGLR